MAWPARKHIDQLIAKAKTFLSDVHINRYDNDTRLQRALIELEGKWRGYRIIVQEIHRADKSVRYSYYVLNENNRLVHGFDNSADKKAIKLRYGTEWKSHINEELPHQHDANRKISLMPTEMTFDRLIDWLNDKFGTGDK